MISATARGFADEAGKKGLAVEGEVRGISQVLAGESEVEDVGTLASELEGLASRVQELEREKSLLEQRMQDLQTRQSEHKAVESQRDALNKQIEKSAGEIARLRKQIAEDDQLLAGREHVKGLANRQQTVVDKINQLHRQISEIQKLEASNREVESALLP